MWATTARPYGAAMPRMRLRLLLVAACAAVVGTLALTLPGGDGPSSSVGAQGESPRRTTSTTRPEVVAPTATSAPEAAAPTTTAPRSDVPRTKVRTSGTTSATTTSPAPTTSTTDGRGPGPQTLAGRLVYFQEDDQVTQSLWSARLDGSDRRREVDCPAPEVPPPSPLPDKDYWLYAEPFDISPDGTHLVRSCLVKAPEMTGRIDLPGAQYALVVQDVDGVGYQELWRYELIWNHVVPTWSPKGDRILVWTTSGLISIKPDGTEKRTIVKFPSTNAQRLTFSPDGTKVVTDSLEILDLATGTWTKPMDAGRPWPYDGGYTAYGVVGWRAEGIWWVTEFISPMGPDPGPKSRGLYHLDPVTNWAKQATRWDQLVSGGEIVGDDIYGWALSHDALVRVTPDGVAHPIPGIVPLGWAIAGP